MNARLTDVCKETGAVMICHDPNFRLANYAANDLLLHKDGIHLSEAGTHRLLQNLDVASEHSIASDDRNLHLNIPTAMPMTFKIREMYPAVGGTQLRGIKVETSHNTNEDYNTNEDIAIDNQADRTNINTGPVQEVVTSLAASSVARAVT